MLRHIFRHAASAAVDITPLLRADIYIAAALPCHAITFHAALPLLMPFSPIVYLCRYAATMRHDMPMMMPLLLLRRRYDALIHAAAVAAFLMQCARHARARARCYVTRLSLLVRARVLTTMFSMARCQLADAC